MTRRTEIGLVFGVLTAAWDFVLGILSFLFSGVITSGLY